MDSVSGFVLGSGMFGSGCYVVLPVRSGAFRLSCFLQWSNRSIGLLTWASF